MILGSPESDALLSAFLEQCWLSSTAFRHDYRIVVEPTHVVFQFAGGIAIRLDWVADGEHANQFIITTKEDRWWISLETDRLAIEWLEALWPNAIANPEKTREVWVLHEDLVVLKMLAH